MHKQFPVGPNNIIESNILNCVFLYAVTNIENELQRVFNFVYTYFTLLQYTRAMLVADSVGVNNFVIVLFISFKVS